MKLNQLCLIVLIVLLIGQAGTVQATDSADRSGVISKRDASAHTLTSGEIDSSTVEVGAYAEVTYYKGEEFEAETLTIGRGFWKEQITFERIQKQIAKANAALDRSKTSRVDKSDVDLYFGEFLLGFLGGHLGGWSGFVCVALTKQTLSLDSFMIGSMLGVAGGVYLPQRSKRFKSFVGALSGSVVAGSLYWKLLGEGLSKRDILFVVPVEVLGSIVGEWGGRKLGRIKARNKRDNHKQGIAIGPLFIPEDTGSVWGIAFNF